jgi:hypothetical protein
MLIASLVVAVCRIAFIVKMQKFMPYMIPIEKGPDMWYDPDIKIPFEEFDVELQTI